MSVVTFVLDVASGVLSHLIKDMIVGQSQHADEQQIRSMVKEEMLKGFTNKDVQNNEQFNWMVEKIVDEIQILSKKIESLEVNHESNRIITSNTNKKKYDLTEELKRLEEIINLRREELNASTIKSEPRDISSNKLKESDIPKGWKKKTSSQKADEMPADIQNLMYRVHMRRNRSKS